MASGDLADAAACIATSINTDTIPIDAFYICADPYKLLYSVPDTHDISNLSMFLANGVYEIAHFLIRTVLPMCDTTMIHMRTAGPSIGSYVQHISTQIDAQLSTFANHHISSWDTIFIHIHAFISEIRAQFVQDTPFVCVTLDEVTWHIHTHNEWVTLGLSVTTTPT